jgi:GT2 family glycosyltransferase
MLTLSLIVCTYKRPQAVSLLLDGVRAQHRIPDQVLIVDGSPDERTRDLVHARIPSWQGGELAYVQVPPEQRGLTRQRNVGIAHTHGSVVAFLDDDTVPEAGYFEELLRCLDRHPEAAGVGGYIADEANWRRGAEPGAGSLDTFRWNEWVRREDVRWRLRRMFGLVSPAPPGWIPPSGHGRPVSFLPPDGADHQVEFVMGGASIWRRATLERHRFSERFDGYGLYEDLDFCIRVSREAPLFLCTLAQLHHYHDPASRPDPFHYGTMVVRNGWYVWRQRWPAPPVADRAKWWATTVLLAACRAADTLRGPHRGEALKEASGRFAAMLAVSMSAERS